MDIELTSTPLLDEVHDLALAQEILGSYDPRDRHQAETRDRIVAWIDAHPEDAHRRTCLAGHLTASAILLDSSRERVLLTLHKKLGKWLQLGGHCDGDANLAGVAWRENVEESGITPAAISALPIDVDIHRIPERPAEPEHDHLDTRYLLVAPGDAREVISDESIELRWFTEDETRELDLDDSVRRLLRLALG